MMPDYAFYCRDGEDAPRIRPTVREAHFEHIFAHVGKYKLGGPLKKGGEPVGSLIVIEGEDEAAARAIFEGDPYFIAGVWQSIDVSEFEFLTGIWRPAEGEI